MLHPIPLCFKFSYPLLRQDENGTLLESDLVNLNGPAESFITGVAGDAASSANSGGSELGSTAGVMTFKILSQICPTSIDLNHISFCSSYVV